MKECRQSTAKRMEKLLIALERLQLADYIRYIDDTPRLLRTQFLGGLARGVGAAIGFTVLGAAVLIILNRLAQRNLPVIGDFLAQLAAIVKRSLEIK